MNKLAKWALRFIGFAIVLNTIATIASVVGGPEDTYNHHTALTGVAGLFVDAFFAAWFVLWLRRD